MRISFEVVQKTTVERIVDATAIHNILGRDEEDGAPSEESYKELMVYALKSLTERPESNQEIKKRPGSNKAMTVAEALAQKISNIKGGKPVTGAQITQILGYANKSGHRFIEVKEEDRRKIRKMNKISVSGEKLVLDIANIQFGLKLTPKQIDALSKNIVIEVVDPKLEEGIFEIKFKGLKAQQNEAMAVNTPVLSKSPGGIDLNARNMGLDIAKEGRGIDMTFDPALIAEFQRGDFSGIEPVIVRIVPISSALPVLGLDT
jgi:hypothetical protein